MDEEQQTFLDKVRLDSFQSSKSRSRFSTIVPWLIVAILSIYIVASHFITVQNAVTIQLWTSSDFESARSAIKPASERFTSSLDFVDPEHIYRIFDPKGLQYVGNASKEIDDNWDQLILREIYSIQPSANVPGLTKIQAADIYISDEEAESMQMTNLYRSKETGKYKIELEVFHSLHCLNMLRMRVYGDAYPNMQTHNAKIHVDHCIESLRELIMCGGNMTPIPIEWSEKGNRLNPNYAQQHSCRDFTALKAWTKDRIENVS